MTGASHNQRRLIHIMWLMPTAHRRAMTLRKVYGYDQKRIANEMNISQDKVAALLAWANRFVAARLETGDGSADTQSKVWPRH